MIAWVKYCLSIAAMAVLVAIVAGLTYMAGFGAGRAGARCGPDSRGFSAAYVSADPAIVVARPVEASVPASAQDQFGVFWDAWNLVEKDFYGPVPSVQERMYGAIRGMIGTLKDAHTVFLDPKTAAIIRNDDSGSFDGIGAAISYDEKIGLPRIAHVYEGQPAAEAGLKQGDVILKVDDAGTENLSVLEVITLIRGPKGSTVHLSILHPDAKSPVDVAVVRDSIQIPITESRLLDNGIAYLKLADFNIVAAQKVREDLSKLLARKPRGLVFDLRGNPGGFLHIAVQVGSQFVGEGLIVTEKSKDGSEQVFKVDPGGLATDKSMPLAVLVDGGTASAAEIVSAAIRDAGRGILIGEKTYGKTSVQEPHSLSDGSQLRVTVARWFTPKGQQIADGLTPDVVVAQGPTDVNSDQDPQLDRAVQYLNSLTR